MILKMSILLPRSHHEQDRPVSASSHPKKSTQQKKNNDLLFHPLLPAKSKPFHLGNTHIKHRQDTVEFQWHQATNPKPANDKGQGAMSNLIKT